MEAIGDVFPAGGPAPPALVVGREEAIRNITRRLREGLSVTIVGPRRIGKTTVGDAVCADIASTHLVVKIEVPEGSDSAQLRDRIAAACDSASLRNEARKTWNAFRPAIADVFKSEGLAVNLPELNADPQAAPWRTLLTLPLAVARTKKKPLLLFLDELQRAVGYADGTEVLADLVDLYGPRTPDAVVLIDGSAERTIESLLGNPHHVGKIAPSEALAERIPVSLWRPALIERFADLDLSIDPDALELLLDWGDGRPYATTVAGLETAAIARKSGTPRVTSFEAQIGIHRAQKWLDDDDA